MRLTAIRRRSNLALLAAFVALAGCAGRGEPSSSITVPEVTIVTSQPPSSGKPSPTAQARVDGAVADLATRLNTDPATITVIEYRDVTWADSSLGCPQPGMSYLQRLTEGSLLILEARGGTRVEYHAGPTGELFYCATPQPPVEGQGSS
jgi:hypothetical protein